MGAADAAAKSVASIQNALQVTSREACDSPCAPKRRPKPPVQNGLPQQRVAVD
jgi:hypothetical protein